MQFGTLPTLLSRAPLRPYGLFGRFCYSPETGDTATATVADPVKTAANKAAPTVPDLTGKLVLSQEELDAKVQAGIDAAQKKAEDKAKREREAAEAEEAKKRGEFEKVALAEKDRADELEKKLRASERREALREHLIEKHADYAGSVVDILPHIPEDVEGDELTKAVAKATTDFIARNPRDEKPRGTPVPLPRTGNRMGFGKDVVVKEKNNGQRPAFSGETSYL